MTTRFSGQVAIVTGAGSGIGRATAQRFAAEGAAVVCLDLDADGAAATAALLGERSVAVTCDVSDAASVEAAVDAAVTTFGGVDVLANVAGTGGSVVFDDLDLVQWNRTLAVNLTGPFLTTSTVLGHLEQRGGCIVNVASVAGLTGIAFAAAYAASKGGLVALSRALALELSDRAVRVRCVCPAGVDTPMVERFRLPEGATVPERARRTRRPLMPAEEVAAAIVDAAADPSFDADPVIVVGR